MNVFEMYVANGRRPGFWLRRTTWGNTCAKVTSVGELKGKPPYYGNPKVLADIFDLQTGDLKEAGAVIPVPGTYKTWRRIQPPSWSGEPHDSTITEESPIPPQAKDDGADAAIVRPSLPDPLSQGRLLLHVSYAQKDVAKGLGARWDSRRRAFWLPIDSDNVEKARELGFLDPPAPPVFFDVPYERRAEIKSLGGQWNRDRRLWWLPSDQETVLKAAEDAGFRRVAREVEGVGSQED